MHSARPIDSSGRRHVASVRTSLLITLLIVGSFLLLDVSEALASDYYYWYALPTTKVMRDTRLPSGAARASSNNTPPTLRLSAAQAEYEGRQIAIRPRTSISGFYLTCSDLVQVTSTGATVTPARIRSGEVSFYWVHYVRIATPTYGQRHRGWFPDALPPMRRADGALLAQDLSTGRNQPFYVLFHVPDGTPKGIYRGTLTMTTRKGRPSVRIPVSLQVYGFSIANQTLRTSFGFSIRCGRSFSAGTGRWPDPRKHPTWESTDFGGDSINRWMQFMSKYRLSPETLIPGVTTPRSTGVIRVRPEYLNDYLGQGQATTFEGERLNFNTIHMPDHLLRPTYLKNPFTSASAKRKAIRYFRTMRDAIGAKNMSRVVVYALDEPKNRLFLNRYTDFVRDILPGVKILTPIYRTWMGGVQPRNIDIQVYKLHFWYRDYNTWIAPARRRGTEFWIYSHTSEHMKTAPLYLIDKPTTDSRVQGWFAYRTGARGLLYFSINRWIDSRNKTKWRDPYSNPLSVEIFVPRMHTTANGEGTLVYPGYYPRLGLSIPGAGPVSSLRMEAVRDGIEDYEYLRQLERKKGRVYALRQVAAIISTNRWFHSETCYRFFPRYSRNPLAYQQTRDRIAGIIDQSP